MNFLYFYKVNPSGNMTVLLEDKQFTRIQKCELAQQALSIGHLHAEQVGFIDIQNGLLDMAGGEFCINATRALGLVMALNTDFDTRHSCWQTQLLVSGSPAPIALDITHLAYTSTAYDVVAHLPFDKPLRMDNVAKGMVLVHMDGIKHLLIHSKICPFNKEHWQKSLASIRQDFGLEDEPALGCIWWDFDETKHMHTHNAAENMTQLQMHPVVRIASPLTECYENACGSGSVALALWMQERFGRSSFFIHQPGGYLTVNITQNEKLTVSVGGPVALVARGEAFFNVSGIF